MLGEYFHVRRLLWDDIGPPIRASEADELRRAVGNELIDGNEELRRELALLVEILSEFQQQSDGIRDALVQRRDQRLPEPPGRALLIGKLKLLAKDLRAANAEHRVLLQCPKDHELLEYVLTQAADDEHEQQREREQEQETSRRPPPTPRMADLAVAFPLSARDGVLLRPGTSGGGPRPSTAASSCCSTRSASTSSAASSIVESPELRRRRRLNVDEIDSIQGDVQAALQDERAQLLEDIEFIQGCIEMEQELLDDDTRQLAAARPPPSLQELQELRRALEKSLEDQHDAARVAAIVGKTEAPSRVVGRRASNKAVVAAEGGLPCHHTVGLAPLPLPLPPVRDSQRRQQQHYVGQKDDEEEEDEHERPLARRRASGSAAATLGGGGGGGGGESDRERERGGGSRTRVLKIRHTVQEARDEPFLT